MYSCYRHESGYAQYELSDSGVCSKEIICMFLVGQVSGLVRNFYVGNFSYTKNVINTELCMMVLYIRWGFPVHDTFSDNDIVLRSQQWQTVSAEGFMLLMN